MNDGIGLRPSWTNRYAIATMTATSAYRRSIRTAPSGQSAMIVVTTPAITMYGHCTCHGSSCFNAAAMTTSSNMAQPSSCTRFSTVGR